MIIKEIKSIQIRKEEIKQPLPSGGMSFYAQYFKELKQQPKRPPGTNK